MAADGRGDLFFAFHRAFAEGKVTEARNDGSDEEDLTGAADGPSDPSEETYGLDLST